MRASQVVALLVAVLSGSTAAGNDQHMMEGHVRTGMPTRKVKVYQFMLPEKNIWNISKGHKKICSGGPYTNWYAESQTDCRLPAGSYTITCCDTRAKEGWAGGYVMIQGKNQKLCKNFDWGANKECYTQQFGLVIPTPKPTPVPTPVPTPKPLPPISPITAWGKWYYWAVDTDTTTDAGVKAACLARNLHTPCQGPKDSCSFSRTCTQTYEGGCGYVNRDLSRHLGCSSVSSCQQLWGVYAYMGEKMGGSAYGFQPNNNGGMTSGTAKIAGKAMCVGHS